MVIEPKVKGFICITAHPDGCEENVRRAVEYSRSHSSEGGNGPKNVLVIGSSTGYGLASRITAAFAFGASTVGVAYERPSSGRRTASAGWYNNAAFEKYAEKYGIPYASLNGDAFSNEMKALTIEAVKNTMPGKKLDMIVYSVAAPKRTDPNTGEVYSSVLKPIGRPYSEKSVDFHTGKVSSVSIEPAADEEIDATVKVMGGEDWLMWIKALKENDLIADNAVTLAYSYIGPELTHAVYKDGTIGRAKTDLEQKAAEIDNLLSDIGAKAYISVNKALVTQSSAAIPVVPLYISILYKLMKENGTHEDCIMQMNRLFHRIYDSANVKSVPTDECGRIRMDDLELDGGIQNRLKDIWSIISSDNIEEITDINGYRRDFYALFGFGLDNIDYSRDIADF